MFLLPNSDYETRLMKPLKNQSTEEWNNLRCPRFWARLSNPYQDGCIATNRTVKMLVLSPTCRRDCLFTTRQSHPSWNTNAAVIPYRRGWTSPAWRELQTAPTLPLNRRLMSSSQSHLKSSKPPTNHGPELQINNFNIALLFFQQSLMTFSSEPTGQIILFTI
jgi:hypothetical protein